ncbi:hypothetical protein [Ideonella sp.]|uniref:hypothetical protein n=1 Tax=Ideonella sp. TaxID=1929293 RepID=UPI002B49639C|nr:hypothetical protein [Ideonella sp.]HJV69911.1 hypothetical protein [Ideonella sp.]
MRSQSIRLALVAGAALAVAGFAQAGTTVDLSKLSPKQQASLAKAQAGKRAITPQYNYDIKAPVLKGVHVGGKVNASLKYAQAVVSLVIADNLAGLRYVSVALQSPSGQYATMDWSADFESKRNELQIGVDMSGATENGTWRITSVTVQDANSNSSYYDESMLAALGHTTFTVYNAAGDVATPSLVAGGVNLTPSVSRSTPPGGMLPGNPARVGVQLNAVDDGVAGVRSAYIQYCHVEGFDCFYMSGSTSVRGQTSAILTLGSHIYEWQSLGAYTPYYMEVYDQSGNGRTYYSWDTDLSAFIDNPVITITE